MSDLIGCYSNWTKMNGVKRLEFGIYTILRLILSPELAVEVGNSTVRVHIKWSVVSSSPD